MATSRTNGGGGAARFRSALEATGLSPEQRSFPESTRSAVEAANAIGCELAQITKSLVFQVDGEPVLVLIDGASRVDPRKVAAALSAERVERADARLVREATGYAIGGVAPFGHATRLRVLADEGLTRHQILWAAAGTPNAVFSLTPAELFAHTKAVLADVSAL
ncbi:YbaK/EbsC family protein [Phaeacidiphilus oryzae]|uniref:YbaK/EbsC family protein n=1 Tax=Phaeacidiphilus oryzae TaxID=348818 RepID=UPI00137875DE|nr:YbaK/EbsC family protein [Phaeacidiphilus oryzae]